MRKARKSSALFLTALVTILFASAAVAVSADGPSVAVKSGIKVPPPQLQAGFGVESLVSELYEGLPLGGYGDRNGAPSEGVHDPVYARTLILKSGDEIAVVVCLDLIGVSHTLRQPLADALPADLPITIDDIMVTATHNHSSYGAMASPSGSIAMDTLFRATCGTFNQGFLDETIANVVESIKEAWNNLAPAKIGVGTMDVPELTTNRGVDGGPIDPQLGVIRVTDLEGKLIGLMANYATHPTCHGGSNMLVTSEYCGAFCNHFEKLHEEGVVAMFIQGAEGDQRPTCPLPHDGAFEKTDRMGFYLAGKVNEVQEHVGAMTSRPAIDFSMQKLDMPASGGFADRLKWAVALHESWFSQLIIDDTLIMSIPGEPCAQIGLDLKSRARETGFKQAFIFGLALDHLGYFVHRDNYAPESASTHQYEKGLNFYGPDVVDRFLEIHFEIFSPRPFLRDAPETAPAPGGGSEDF
ncbi:MAG: neutral/alkaline non-lysosomal ceramidase N-terminal domain-containing protein [Planctomycetes bacterium]|nr:neutral/alkaline non-lysosomal ceramidase N-terminal domain-containing protein [Planctomycetota bacterium]